MPINEYIELSRDNHNMFTIIDFEYSDIFNFQIGIRNSTNKSFSLGMCAGIRVLVCSNMSFNGSFTIMHVHDSKLSVDVILQMLDKAIGTMLRKGNNMALWLSQLCQLPIDRYMMGDLQHRIAINKLIPPSQIVNLHKYVETEKANYGYSVATVQNGLTRFYRKVNLFKQQQKISIANKFFDNYCGKVFTPDEYTIKLVA